MTTVIDLFESSYIAVVWRFEAFDFKPQSEEIELLDSLRFYIQAEEFNSTFT